MDSNIFELQEIAININSSSKFQSSLGHSLLYFRKGTLIADINNTPYTATNHSYLLLRKEEQIHFSNHYDSDCIIYVLSFNADSFLQSENNESLTKCFEKDSINKCRHIISQSETSMRVRTLLLLIMIEIKNEKYATEIFKSNALSMLLVILNRLVLENIIPEKTSCKKGLRLDDIFTYVNSHLTEEISLDTLSEDLFFSKYHILHEFKKKTGISLYKYIIKRRLDYSKTLIESGMHIKEVCHNCGFGDYSNYFRSFKKEYGYTPKQYYNKVTTKLSTELIHLTSSK